MKLILTALVFLATTFATLATAQQTPASSLLALSKRDHTLAIIDPSSLKVIAKAPVGNDPHEVIASSDGKTAYVSNYGFGAFNTLAVIDLVAQKPLPAVDLGPLRGPHGLDFAAGKVWFTAEGAKAIASYDPGTRSVDWILGTGQNRTHMIHVSSDTKTIITTNVSSGTVSLIEKSAARPGFAGPGFAGPGFAEPGFAEPGLGGPRPGGAPPQAPPNMAAGAPSGPPPGGGPNAPPTTPGGDWNETVVKVGNGSEGFDVTPDGRQIWVANAGDGTISIIDIAAKQVTQTLATDVRGANRLKFTTDGKLALISQLGGPDVTVIDTATRKIVKRIAVGQGSAGILQPDGSRAFVACTPDNYVAVIDLHSLQVVGHIDAGPEPDGLAWATRP
jgi:YVTN family beta-propeller protein